MRCLKTELFPMTLILIDDDAEYEKIMHRKSQGSDEIPFPPKGGAHTVCIESYGAGLVIMVTLGDFSDESEDLTESLLIHEAVHVWQFTRDAMNEEKPGIETEAYAIQYYARYLMEEFHYRRNLEIQKAKQPASKRAQKRK